MQNGRQVSGSTKMRIKNSREASTVDSKRDVFYQKKKKFSGQNNSVQRCYDNMLPSMPSFQVHVAEQSYRTVAVGLVPQSAAQRKGNVGPPFLTVSLDVLLCRQFKILFLEPRRGEQPASHHLCPQRHSRSWARVTPESLRSSLGASLQGKGRRDFMQYSKGGHDFI